MSAKVSVQPGMRLGVPVIDGTRLDVDLVVRSYLSLGLDETLLSYPHLTRDDVLVACWYAARYERWRSLEAWLVEHEDALWGSSDWSGVPLPPREAA